MEKRLLIALGLAALVILLSQRLFPGPPTPAKPGVDTATTHSVNGDSVRSSQATESVAASTPALKQSDGNSGRDLPHDTISLVTPRATYHFTAVGAAPLDVVLSDYHKLPKRLEQNVVLGRPRIPLLSYAIVNSRDTLYFDRINFRVDSSRIGGSSGITFKADTQNLHVTVAYGFNADGYLASVKGSVV